MTDTAMIPKTRTMQMTQKAYEWTAEDEPNHEEHNTNITLNNHKYQWTRPAIIGNQGGDAPLLILE